jgi:hypothetical protein
LSISPTPFLLSIWESPLTINNPEFDWKYLCDYNNLVQIKENIERRKGVGDIDKLVSYHHLIIQIMKW